MTSPDDRDGRAPRTSGPAGFAVGLLTREAGRVPILALTLALEAWERTRGVRTFVLRRGNEALQIAAHTPLGRLLPQPVLDDGADREAAEIALSAARETASSTIAEAAGTEQSAPPAPRPAASQPAAQRPAKQPATPRPGKPSTAKGPAAETRAAKSAGAPGSATVTAEQVAEKLDVTTPTSRDELPIADFDNVSLGSLRARLRSLSVEQLVVLREWEQAHAHRLPVMTLLDNRIAKLATDRGSATPAYPSRPADDRNQPAAAAPPAAEQAADEARDAARDEGGTLRI